MSFFGGESGPIVLTTMRSGLAEEKKIILKTLLPYGRDDTRPRRDTAVSRRGRLASWPSRVVASMMGFRLSLEAAVEKNYPDLQVTDLAESPPHRAVSRLDFSELFPPRRLVVVLVIACIISKLFSPAAIFATPH
jgi:hypothetical protein